MQSSPHPEPPELWHSLSEGARALLEVNQLLLSRALLQRMPRGDGHPVMTLPGFGGADGCMAPLRSWLNRWGYDARPWNLGRNFPKYRMTSLDAAMAMSSSSLKRRGTARPARAGMPLSLMAVCSTSAQLTGHFRVGAPYCCTLEIISAVAN